MKKLFPLLLLATTVLADVPLKNEGVSVGNVITLDCVGSAINCTRTLSTGTITIAAPGETTADLQLYVDPLGSDSNACTSTGASACLTPQGAINKVPKFLKHRARVLLAAGSYASFNATAFNSDTGTQQTTAGLVIDGTLVSSTLATDTPTGTATGGTAGSTSTFGTLVDSTKAFTVNDLRGRFVEITGGTGVLQVKAIASNTADTITIAGTWTAPIAGSTYAIRDSASFITGCQGIPPAPGATAAGATSVAIRIAGNSSSVNIQLRGLAVSAACNFAVEQTDAAGLIVNRMLFTSTTGTAAKVSFGAGAAFYDTNVSIYSSTSGTHLRSGALAWQNASVLGNVTNGSASGGATGTVQNSVFINGSTAVNASGFRSSTLLGLEIIDANTGGIFTGGVTTNLQGIHIDCTGSASAVGLHLSSALAPGGAVTPDHVDFTDCNTAIRVASPTAFLLSANVLTATGVTTYLDARYGGRIGLSASVPTGTVTTEVILDNDATATSTIAAIASGSCFASLSTGSRVCKD